MENYQSFDLLLNFARGEYYNRRYTTSIAAYETLLRFVTAIGNTVNEEKRTEYTQLYQKYYEEYQFVFKFYNDLLTQHKVDSAQNAIHYDSPLQNPSQKRDATQEILDSFNKAGQAIIKSLKEFDEKCKITETSKKILHTSVEKTKEFDEKHHISEKFKETGDKIKTYNEEHHVAETMAHAFKVTGEAMVNSLTAALQGLLKALEGIQQKNTQENSSEKDVSMTEPLVDSAAPSEPEKETLPTPDI